MAKTRTDSWAAGLTEEQSWTLYYKAMRCHWNDAAAWAVKEFELERMPSRTGFYEWLKAMRAAEHEHRMGQAAIAAAEAAALGKKATKDESLIAALKTLATEAALNTDAKTASALIQSAMAIKDRVQKENDLALKAKAQGVKEEELKLAREKFEFDAAKKAMELAAEIKTIAADDALDDDEKIQKVREALFGV